MNNVLNNLNALNRSLEGVVAVGKEFESVSLLWNNYYDGLARISVHQQQQAEAQARAQGQTQSGNTGSAAENEQARGDQDEMDTRPN